MQTEDFQLWDEGNTVWVAEALIGRFVWGIKVLNYYFNEHFNLDFSVRLQIINLGEKKPPSLCTGMSIFITNSANLFHSVG